MVSDEGPLSSTDHDSEGDYTDGDGDAGLGGRSSVGGGTYYATSSGDTPSHREGTAHSLTDQEATGREAKTGTCALDTAEMPSHKPARNPSLPTPSATHLPLLVSANTSSSPFSLSAHSPPLSSLFSHWEFGNPPPRRKLYDMNGKRDDRDEDVNEEEGDVDEYNMEDSTEDVGDDGDDEEDVDDGIHDGCYVDEDDETLN